MKVLYITNAYPTEMQLYYGIFVQEQIDAIKDNMDIDSKIYFVDGISSKLNYLKSIIKINLLINIWKPDIIHIHYGLSGLFVLFNPFIKKRTILTLHGGDILSEQGKSIQVFLTKLIIRHVGNVFLLSDEMIKVVKPLHCNYHIIKCGVNANMFNCQNDNNFKKKDTRSFLLVFPSDKNRKIKDFPLFMEVFLKLKERHLDIDFIFKEIKNMNRIEVNNLLCQADCLLMTSISEGSPQVIKEAMACNLPIVTVDVGDVGEILLNVNNCYVSDTRDKIKLTFLVEKILENRERSNGRDALRKQKLDNDEIARLIIEQYQQIQKNLLL